MISRSFMRSRIQVAGFIKHMACQTGVNSASGTAVSEAKKKSAGLLRGQWYNELGSTMKIEYVSPQGHLRGWYETAVGRQTGKKFELVGNVSTHQESPTFGFCVVWKESTTSWVGQFYDVAGKQQLLTTWVLRSDVAIADDWESTLIGKDQFTREDPLKK